MDVEATHQVFTEQLPLFMERSVNPNPHFLLTFKCIDFLAKNMTLLCPQCCIIVPSLLSFYKVPSSSDVCRNAGDGCELPSRQSQLGALPGRFSGHLRRAPEGDEEVSDGSSGRCLSAAAGWQVRRATIYHHVCDWSKLLLLFCDEVKRITCFCIICSTITPRVGALKCFV